MLKAEKARESARREIAKAKEAEEVNRGESLLKQIKYLQMKALAILKTSEASGDLRTALKAIREARGNLELLAKLQGELAQEGSMNIVLSPSWISLRTVILKALEPYPEAKLQLAEKLREIDYES
jgi:hypothetical protein